MAANEEGWVKQLPLYSVPTNQTLKSLRLIKLITSSGNVTYSQGEKGRHERKELEDGMEVMQPR